MHTIYLVYIKAFDGVYAPVSVDGAASYPEIHYYAESKCIIQAAGTTNKSFGDFTNGAGNYCYVTYSSKYGIEW